MKLRKVYKSAKKSIEEWGGGSFRPELPGPENLHKFPFHGLFTKMGGKPVNTPMEQKQDPKGDIAIGEKAAEDAKEIEELPETLSLSELFKFTVSGRDNTSQGVHTMGGGFPAYGKGLDDFSSLDPDSKHVKTKKRFQTLDGRNSQRVKPVARKIKQLSMDELTHDGTGVDTNDELEEALFEMNYRDSGQAGGTKTTKQPYASGIPGRDKKDIVGGYEKIDELVKLNKKEEQKAEDEKQEKKEDRRKELELSEGGALSSFNKLHGQKIAHSAKSDLNFWEICDHENVYIMGKQPERVKNGKTSKTKKKSSKRSK